MAASTNKKSVIAKQKEMFVKQQKRKVGKTISSVKLFIFVPHV